MRAAESHHQITSGQWHNEEVALNDVVEELKIVSKDLAIGTGSQAQSILAAQSVLLDKLFNLLTVRGMLNTNSGNLGYSAEFLKLAFKAQSNCRSTLQSISDINHPRQHVSQINMAENQQVINKFSQNQLSGEPVELRANRGTQRGAAPADSTLEALDEINGATVGRR